MNALISGAAVVAGAGPRGDDVRPAWPALVMNRLPPSMTHAAAVGAVLVAGRRARAAGVAAGAGLGQAVRADDLAAAPSGRGSAAAARACPARWSGPQPRLVCAATISPSEPQTRPISSIAIA